MVKQRKAIPVCPEQLGGLKTPKISQEIQGGTGEDVLNKKSKVVNKNREDVTKQFIRGSEETRKNNCSKKYKRIGLLPFA